MTTSIQGWRFRLLPALLCTALSCATASAQQASFSTFGQGCTLERQVLAIGNVGLPVLGQSFDVTYSGPNYVFSSGQRQAQPLLVLGFSQQTTPLAFPLPGQPVGCFGWIRPDDLLVPGVAPSGNSYLPITLPVPNDPNLLGVTAYAQWLTALYQCGFAGCNLDALGTSDAASMVLGL